MSRFSSGFFDLHRDIEERDGVTRITRRNLLLQTLLKDAEHARGTINLDLTSSLGASGCIQMF